ncbi:MAG: 3-isopropylmalate dehydratase large subunit, partial [Calditrichaeota bacterium]
VYIEALKKGLIRVLVEAGAIILFPGEHSLFDPTIPLLADGERALVTANRSLFGSLDASKNEIFTASPATTAASAINGSLTDPVRYLK